MFELKKMGGLNTGYWDLGYAFKIAKRNEAR